MSRLGQRVREARTKKGLSPKQLGKKVGVSESFISEIELGNKIINDSLLKRISKVLGEDINDSIFYEESSPSQEESTFSVSKHSSHKISKKAEEPQEIWNSAFGSILMTLPVYKYDFMTKVSEKQYPIISNKVEGYSKDKVVVIEIEDNSMIGFRIAKGDIALCHITHEIVHNSICLLEKDDKRVIRQIKKLDSKRILLIKNSGTVETETLSANSIKVLAQLHKIEFYL